PEQYRHADVEQHQEAGENHQRHKRDHGEGGDEIDERLDFEITRQVEAGGGLGRVDRRGGVEAQFTQPDQLGDKVELDFFAGADPADVLQGVFGETALLAADDDV